MSNLPDEHDTEDVATLAFYNEKAEAYAARARPERNPLLERFIERGEPPMNSDGHR